MEKIFRFAVLLACALALLVNSPVAATTVETPTNNVAVQWNYLFFQIYCRQSGTIVEPHSLYVQLHLAQWHALLALKNTGACTTQEVVVAYASHKILSTYFPFEQVATIDPLLTAQLKTLRVSDAEEKLGKQLGEAVARDLIAKRATAREFALRALKRALDAEANAPRPGIYRYLNNTPAGRDAATFIFYEMPFVQPYVVPEPVVFIKKHLSELKPPKVPSDEWDAEYEKAKNAGRADWPGRTREMNVTPALLSCPKVNTVACNPTATWAAIARALLPKGTSLSDTVTLFAKLAVSHHDSLVVLTTLQYGFWFWRPEMAFRAGDSRHEPIPNWTPYLATPPHAEYPSGTVATVSSAATALENFFGAKVPFLLSIGGEYAPECPLQGPVPDRKFKSFAALVTAYREARFYGGAHWDISVVDGEKVGERVGKYVEEHWTERPASGVLPDPTFMKVFAELPKRQTGWSPMRFVI